MRPISVIVHNDAELSIRGGGSLCRQIQNKENYFFLEILRFKLLKELQAARSEEFDAIFQADTNAKEIEIPEMGGEELKAFVSFFYTGSLPINVIAEYMTTFLHVAEKYKVHYLAAVCEDVLVSKLSRDNAITTFDIAKKYCSSDVKEAVLKKALKMGEISTYGEYKLYTQKDPGLLLEFYEQLSERIGPLLAKRRRITPGMFHLALWTLQLFFSGVALCQAITGFAVNSDCWNQIIP